MVVYGKGLRALAAASIMAVAAALWLVFLYAPIDADQGFVQKIFYLHVPMAIVALCGFIAAAVMAIAHLRSGRLPGTCAHTWRSTSRSSSAWACSSPARSGRRRRGGTGGCGTSRRSSRS